MSAASYNDRLSRKNKIDNLRSTIMNISDKFYAIKWIKILYILIMMLSISFVITFILFYDALLLNLSKTNDLANNIRPKFIFFFIKTQIE